MTNEEKQTRIRPWINPEERVTVHFLDVPDLNISVPLSQIEVAEDFSHYTRDPERPLQQQRLMLVINEKRPPIIY